MHWGDADFGDTRAPDVHGLLDSDVAGRPDRLHPRDVGSIIADWADGFGHASAPVADTVGAGVPSSAIPEWSSDSPLPEVWPTHLPAKPLP